MKAEKSAQLHRHDLGVAQCGQLRNLASEYHERIGPWWNLNKGCAQPTRLRTFFDCQMPIADWQRSKSHQLEFRPELSSKYKARRTKLADWRSEIESRQCPSSSGWCPVSDVVCVKLIRTLLRLTDGMTLRVIESAKTTKAIDTPSKSGPGYE